MPRRRSSIKQYAETGTDAPVKGWKHLNHPELSVLMKYAYVAVDLHWQDRQSKVSKKVA